VLSNKNKQLFAIIFYNSKNEVIKKQFFEDYKNLKGVSFPHKVVEIVYKDGKEYYQVSTYKNVVLNDMYEEHMYYYTIPVTE
jgi:hypothetical protein